MNEQWFEFLSEHGAVIDESTVTSFGSQVQELTAALQKTVLCDLSHNAIISVDGADAEKFLQGQLCNDVAKVSPQNSQINGYCTPKGRLICIVRLFKFQQRHHLKLPRVMMANCLERLKKFVLMADVTFNDLSPHWAHIGISGDSAPSLVTDALGVCPTDDNGCAVAGDMHVIRIAGPAARFEVAGPVDQIQALWGRWRQHAQPAGYPVWNWLDIRAGLPAVFPETTEEFIPQTMNFDAIGGLSFQKGCYPGQEIIARMNYLGTLKRRMYMLHGDFSDAPPGTAVYAKTGESSQPAGKVANAAASPEGGCDILAVLQIEHAEKGGLHLGGEHGEQLNMLSLPYTLPPPKKSE